MPAGVNRTQAFGNPPTCLVSLPCCHRFNPTKDIGRGPDEEFDDEAIFSACRRVLVWRWPRGPTAGAPSRLDRLGRMLEEAVAEVARLAPEEATLSRQLLAVASSTATATAATAATAAASSASAAAAADFEDTRAAAGAVNAKGEDGAPRGSDTTAAAGGSSAGMLGGRLAYLRSRLGQLRLRREALQAELDRR
jgi:hypothetical protein